MDAVDSAVRPEVEQQELAPKVAERESPSARVHPIERIGEVRGANGGRGDSVGHGRDASRRRECGLSAHDAPPALLRLARARRIELPSLPVAQLAMASRPLLLAGAWPPRSIPGTPFRSSWSDAATRGRMPPPRLRPWRLVRSTIRSCSSAARGWARRIWRTR